MSRPRKVLIFVVVIVALTLLTSAFLRSAWFQQKLVSWMQSSLEESYGIRLEVDTFEYSLSGGLHITMGGVRAREQSSTVPFFTARQLEILAPYSILWRSAKIVDRIVVQDLNLDLDRIPRFQTTESSGETSIQIRSIRVMSGSLSVEQRSIKNLELEMSLEPDKLIVKKAAAVYEGVSLSAKGSVELDPVRLDLTYEAEGNLNVIGKLAPEAPQLSGPFHAEGKISGEASDLRVEGTYRSTDVSLAGAAPASVTGNFQYAPTSEEEPLRLDMEWQRLPMAALARINPKIPEMHSTSTGRLTYSGGLELWSGAGAFETALDPLKGALPLSGHVSGVLSKEQLILSKTDLSLRSLHAQIDGSVNQNGLDLVVKASAADLRDLGALVPELRKIPAEATFEGTVSGNYESLRIQGLSNLNAYSSSLRVEGFYDLKSESLEAEYQGNLSNEFWMRLGYPEVQGEMKFAGRASGNANHPVMDASLSSANLVLSGIPIGALDGTLKSDGKSLRADFELPDLHTSVNGDYAWKAGQFSVNSTFEELSTALFRPLIPESLNQIEGSFTGNLSISGSRSQWKNAAMHAEISKAILKHKGRDLEALVSGTIDLRDQVLDLNIEAQSQNSEVRIAGKAPIDPGKKMDLKILGNLDVKTLSLVFPEYEFSGSATADIHVRGTRTIPQISGEVKLNAVNASGKDQKLSVQNVNGTVQLKDSTVHASLQGMLNDAQMDLIASIPLEKKPGNVKLTVPQLQLSTFFPGSNVAGVVRLDVSAMGQGTRPEDWNGTAAMQITELRVGSDVISVAEPIQVNLDRGVATVPPFRLNAAGLLDAVIGGNYRLKDGAIEAELQAQADLSLLSQLMTDIQGSGPVKAVVSMKGTLKAPVWNGHLSAEDVFVRHLQYPLILEQVRFEAPFNEQGLELKTFTARMGGGFVEAGGGMAFEQRKPGPIKVWIKGRDIGLNYPEGLRSLIDTDLQWNGTLTASELSGTVRVLRSLYNEDIDYRDRLINTLLSQQKDLRAPSTVAGRVKLNLQVQTVQDFRLRNNIARLRSAGDFKITGTGAQPRIGGQLLIREGGLVFFEGNDFVVENAVLSFFGTTELNPSFDATLYTTATAKDSERNLQDFDITVRLRGPLDNYQLELSSSPPLSDTEIYSILLTGELRELGDTAGLIFQRQLAAYLSGRLFFDFQKRIAGALGFSQFEILPPDLISSEQDPGVRLIVAKELASGFEVQYSALLSQHTDSTWIATYRFRNRFSLRFVDQEDGGYTGGLRHSLRFGGAPNLRRIAPRTPRIARLQIENESVLDLQTIREKLNVREGQKYDPWKLEDQAEELKKQFQKRGFLFPTVEIQETLQEDVSLLIRVQDGGRRVMQFSGIQVPGKSMDKYEQWWREGLSETVVMTQIADDLQSQLYNQGHHKAVVRTSKQEAEEAVVYGFAAEPGPVFTKIEVRYTGESNYPDFELDRDLQAFYGSQDVLLHEAVHRFHSFKEKVTALYVRKGFLDVQVDSAGLTFSSPNVVREVRIQEGPSSRISALEISGGQKFPPELLGRLKMIPGAIYDSQLLSEDEVTVSEFYQNQGYWKTQVRTEVEKVQETGIGILYDLQTGGVARIRSVSISGNQRTRESLILRRISVNPGDLLTRALLIETQNRIEVTQLFRQVKVEPKETDTPDLYDLEIVVVESEPYDFTYGLRYDSEQDLEGEVQLHDSNLFGTGQNVLVYGRRSSTDSLYRFIFHSAPSARRRETLATLPWRTLASLSYEEKKTDEFISKLTSIEFQRRWEFLEPLVFLTTYKFEQGRITSRETGGEVPFDLRQDISRLIGVVILDTRDDALNPSRGLLLTNEVEYSPEFLGTDLIFTKNYSQYFQYLRLGPVVSASAVRVGVGWDLIGSERFFAGGQATIRGFELDEVGPHSRFTGLPTGGESVLIVNQEFRFPLYSWIGGVVFYDGGNVYPTVSELRLRDIRNTAGFGLRLLSPYGVGRFDIGFNLNPEDDESSYVLHFGLGQAW